VTSVLIGSDLAAQSTKTADGRELYLFAAEDFGIDPEGVTYSKDIAPILQRSCVSCHRADGGAPMSLMSYREVRPWASRIRERTAIRDRRGTMPPWFVEKGVGIQHFKDDTSLSDAELATIQAWVANGAPEGNPSDLPPAVTFADANTWTIGEPDLILQSQEITVPPVGADWWGNLGIVPTGLTKDRYISAIQVREINDIPRDAENKTVGGRFVWHHQTYSQVVLDENGEPVTGGPGGGGGGGMPIHEVGRNADVMPQEAGLLLRANSAFNLTAAHIHPNGRETKAHLEFGIKFFPEGYEPLYRRATGLGQQNSTDVYSAPGTGGQEFHTYTVLEQHTKMVTFEPHMHAPGTRMCVEAIWGANVITLNCVGYDHNWVKQYVYDEDYAPLLPKGTIVHLVGWLDGSAANPNVVDPRNWAGSGRRSVANMFNDLGWTVRLTEEQFQAEMAARRERMRDRNDYDPGCPLCWAPVEEPAYQAATSAALPAGVGR
jgi:mono/diheme cytochrome c family protein